jgi:type IV pilus assembly protein PilB
LRSPCSTVRRSDYRRSAKEREKPASIPPAQLTAGDLISALRAVAHGADASEILGERVPVEALLAALLATLLKKGLIADWDFVDEFRKT